MEKSLPRTARLNLGLTELRQCWAMMHTHSAFAPTSATAIPAYSPDQWLFQLFSPLAVAEGGPIRRSVADVDANIVRDRFLEEVKLRGYKAKEVAGHFVLQPKRSPMPVMI